MKRHDLGATLAACGAATCFALALTMPAAGADTINVGNNTVGNQSATVPDNTANGSAGTNNNASAPGQSNGDAGYCLGILFRADCATSSGSTTPPPSGSPAPTAGGSATVNGGNAANGSVAANGTADGTNGTAGANATVGTSGAPSGSSTGPCDNSTSASAGTSGPLGPLSADLLTGGGILGTLVAGAMAVRRLRNGA